MVKKTSYAAHVGREVVRLLAAGQPLQVGQLAAALGMPLTANFRRRVKELVEFEYIATCFQRGVGGRYAIHYCSLEWAKLHKVGMLDLVPLSLDARTGAPKYHAA